MIMFKVKNDIFFQFPIGFSQPARPPSSDTVTNFQFPIGFSLLSRFSDKRIEEFIFQFPIGFSLSDTS